MSTRPSGAGGMGTGCMVLFFGFFAAFSLLFLSIVAWLVVLPQYHANAKYLQNDCVVLDKRISEGRGDNGKTYRPEFQIQYQVDGRNFEAWTYDASEMYSSGRASKQKILDQFEVGQRYPCWYDPDDPSKVILVRGYHWSIALFLGVPMIFLAVGFGGIFFTLRSAYRQSKVDESRSPEFRDVVSTFGFLMANRKKSPEWKALQAEQFLAKQGLKPPSEGLQQRYPTTPDIKAEESPGKNLKYLLPGDSSAKASAFFLFFFAVFWNGITSVFVVLAVRSHLVGNPEWFLTFFIVPFVLIGLFLIYAFLHELLIKIGIPPTVVEISAHPLRTGDRCAFHISQPGPLTLNALTVSLVCEEIATYRQGTTTRNETYRVFENELIQQEGIEVRREFPFEADGSLSIPEAAMHSFEGGHNKVVWKILVKGDVARWPDFERSFPLVVLPAQGPEVSQNG